MSEVSGDPDFQVAAVTYPREDLPAPKPALRQTYDRPTTALRRQCPDCPIIRERETNAATVRRPMEFTL